MNGYESYEQRNEIKKIEEDDSLIEQREYQEDGQFYFYQMGQQQILEQERLMEEYKQ